MKYVVVFTIYTLVLVIVLLTKFQPEDVNRDGQVDAKDLLIVRKYIEAQK